MKVTINLLYLQEHSPLPVQRPVPRRGHSMRVHISRSSGGKGNTGVFDTLNWVPLRALVPEVVHEVISAAHEVRVLVICACACVYGEGDPDVDKIAELWCHKRRANRWCTCSIVEDVPVRKVKRGYRGASSLQGICI